MGDFRSQERKRFVTLHQGLRRWVAETAETSEGVVCYWTTAAEGYVSVDLTHASPFSSFAAASGTHGTPCRRCPVMSLHT